MIEYANECCDCATSTYPCRGESCERRRAKHYHCDGCGDEAKLYYANDGGMYCIDCIQEFLDAVDGSGT